MTSSHTAAPTDRAGAASYDEAPYPDLSYAHTHPDALHVLARISGLRAPPVEGSRVLEIGCAGGGNLIPMAYSMPDASFVGIDYSGRQIASGNEWIDAAGLRNISLLHMDVADLGPDWGEFDYIVAHGFYSWVAAPIRETLLRACKHLLAPQGVAYVSYNTYPGWHIAGAIRGAMLFHARKQRPPNARAERARAIIDFLADNVPSARGAYAEIFKSYRVFLGADRKGADDGLLLHDELESDNDPVYFYEFVGHAAANGLKFLAEAELEPSPSQELGEDVLERVRRLSADPLEVEQYLDLLTNRMFRQSLLVHERANVHKVGALETVKDLQLASSATPSLAADDSPPGSERFVGPDGAGMTTDHEPTKKALRLLRDRFPLAVSFDELLRSPADSSEGGDAVDSGGPDRAALAENLLGAHRHSARLVELHGFCPRHLGVRLSERPAASAVARKQSQSSDIVTNLWHAPVHLDERTRALLPLLDGTRSIAELEAGFDANTGAALRSTLGALAAAALLLKAPD